MKVISLENLKTFYNNLEEKIDSKVDKIEGKGLSTNDYTTEDKNKLDNLSDRVSQIQAATDAEIDTIFTEGIA